MKFTKQQKAIIRKIASGEITDIPSYIKAFNLSTFYILNKEDIEKRMEIDENGKVYKKLKDGVETIRTTTSTNNALGLSMPSFIPIIPKEEDFEAVLATISFHGSSKTIETDETTNFEYDFFEGINVTNSFSDIKDFLTIWQFLKFEGLVLEVGKKTTKADYEPFFEYKPILKTKYGKAAEEKRKKKAEIKVDGYTMRSKEKALELTALFQGSDPERIKDYRNYIDRYFEYNKASELICSQFINKQIYGNSALEIFIKKRFKTNEEINISKALIPAYLALVLTLGIALWQNFSDDTSSIIAIQNQLTEIHQTLSDKPSPDLTKIENKIQEIIDNSNIITNEQLYEILQTINEYEPTP